MTAVASPLFLQSQINQSKVQDHKAVKRQLHFFISRFAPVRVLSEYRYIQSSPVLLCPHSADLHLFGLLALSLNPDGVCPLESNESEPFIAGETELQKGQDFLFMSVL